jgi:hypothetical protein
VIVETAKRFGANGTLGNNGGYDGAAFLRTFTNAKVRRRFKVDLIATVHVARVPSQNQAKFRQHH